MKLYNSTHNFFRGNESSKTLEKLLKYNNSTEINNIEVVRNEEFGFFAVFKSDSQCFINLENEYDLPWWGLDRRYRLKVESELDITSHLIAYVKDDDDIEKADIILNEKSGEYPKGEVPIFIEGKIPEDFKEDSFKIVIKLFSANGYEAERLEEKRTITVRVIDYKLDMNIEKSFYLDLWQHPSSWARVYRVDYFSDQHFDIIEKYIKEMAKLGQKVIDLIVSDFPWAGQKCFGINKNPSRLYEYNIVSVRKKAGKFIYDFRNMDRYIDLCMKYGIKDEINIFGIIGNWHGLDFGSPIEEYRDPIRVKVYDEDMGIYDFIRNKNELKKYIRAIFDHLDKRGLLEITKVIGDEPGANDLFKVFSEFIEEASGRKINFKYALHSNSFFREYKGDMDSFSMNTLLLADSSENGKVIGKLGENAHKMTWYSCCFPENFNVFIKSPLIESRYIGPYTYIWNFKGMLRWAYGIYVEDVYKDIRYKPEKWAAGDMFFIYPGKNGEPLHSLREKNMLYSIQDFNIFRKLEKEGVDVQKELKERLSISGNIDRVDNNVLLEEYKNINDYEKIRNEIIKSVLK